MRLEIPARLEMVRLARRMVTEVGRGVAGLSHARLFDLGVAVSEICTNAVEAHDRDGVEGSVVVECAVRSDAVEVTIRDQAWGFDGPVALEGLADGPDHHLTQRGRGLMLVHRLADEVRVDSSDDGTTVVVVVAAAGTGPKEPQR